MLIDCGSTWSKRRWVPGGGRRIISAHFLRLFNAAGAGRRRSRRRRPGRLAWRLVFKLPGFAGAHSSRSARRHSGARLLGVSGADLPGGPAPQISLFQRLSLSSWQCLSLSLSLCLLSLLSLSVSVLFGVRSSEQKDELTGRYLQVAAEIDTKRAPVEAATA